MFERVCEPTVDGVQQADPFALATVLSGLTHRRVHELSAEQAECVIAATQRVINVLSACQSAAIDRFTDHVLDQRAVDQERAGRVLVGAPSPKQLSAAMLAPILRIAPRTMVSRITSARWLNLLPRTNDLAWAGDLEPYRVTVITRAAEQVGLDDLLEFEARLHHGDLRSMPCSRVKARATAITGRLNTRKPANPTTPLPRWVRVHPDSQPGCAAWDALLPADVSHRMWTAIQALAGQYRQANPTLTADQSRADAFTDLVLGNAHVNTTALLVIPTLSTCGPASEGGGRASGPDVSESRADTDAAATAPVSEGPVVTSRRGVDNDDSAERDVSPDVQASLDTADATARAGTAASHDGAGSEERAATPVAATVTASDPTAVASDGRAQPDAGPESPVGASSADTGEATGVEFIGSGSPASASPARFCRDAASPAAPEALALRLARARAHDCGSCGRPLPRVESVHPPDWLTLVDDDDSEFEWQLTTTLTNVVAADRNPHLTRDAHGEVWFVPGVVTAPGVTTLLPDQVIAILADPDTTVRLARAHPHTGAVDSLDEHSYRPGAALARLIRARDGTCRFPGCTTEAARCHLDHVTRYPDGPTTAENLQSLCSVHHGFKHHANWTVTMTPEGICTWTAPSGRSHTTHPHAVHDHAA